MLGGKGVVVVVAVVFVLMLEVVSLFVSLLLAVLV